MLGQANERTNTNAKAHVASFLNNITPYNIFAQKKMDIVHIRKQLVKVSGFLDYFSET